MKRARAFVPAVLITAACLGYPACCGSAASQHALYPVLGSGPGGVGAARDEWFLSDVFKTSSSWGGDAPCNETAPGPPPHVHVLHLDQDGPMFAAREDDQCGAEPPGKRRRPWDRASEARGAASEAVRDEGEEGAWAECEDDADGLASAFGYTRAFGEGCSRVRIPTMPPALSPTELLTMLKACSGDAKDLFKVLNLVPGYSKASVEQQLQRALSSRARLIVAYFRQRLIEVPEDAPSAWRAGAGPAREGHAREAQAIGNKRLMRMDEALPDLFDELDQRLNLRDGYATMWQAVESAKPESPVPRVPVHGVVTLRGNSSANGGSARQVRLELTRSPPQLRDGRWSLKRMLVPIEDSPYAPTRRADSALWAAAVEGDVVQVELALHNGARINALMPNIGAWTALHMAAVRGHVDVVRCLAARGANVSLATKEGYTPLHVAAAAGQLAVVEQLVALGASLEAVNHNRDTPLHRAAANGHVEVARQLVMLGASVYSRNEALRIPADEARTMAACFDSHPVAARTAADTVEKWRERLLNLAALLMPGEEGGEGDRGLEEDGGGGWGVFDRRNVDRCVFVNGLDLDVGSDEVKAVFEKCGALIEFVLAPPRFEAARCRAFFIFSFCSLVLLSCV
jgi:hypothetical protein